MCLLGCLLFWTPEGWGESRLHGGSTPPNLPYEGRDKIEKYWRDLQAVAERRYGGRFWESFEVTLGGGFERREFEHSAKSAPFGEFKVVLPLFSPTKKQEMVEAKRAFLQEASGYLQEIEGGRRLAEILRENLRVKKEILQGADGAAADAGSLEKQEKRMGEYLALSERLVGVLAGVRDAERKIEAMMGGRERL